MKKKMSRRTWINIIVIIVLVAVALLATFVGALYLKKTNDVKNTFSPAASIPPEIKEEFDHETKEDVYFEVGTTGYPVFVRAAIIITWKNGDDVVHFTKPVQDTDYEIRLKTASGDDWFYRGEDGFYYYKNAVESEGKTTVLLEFCRQLDTATPPEGYTLSVEIIVQTVQAVGYTDGEMEGDTIKPGSEIEAWRDAWGWGTTEKPEPEAAPDTEVSPDPEPEPDPVP